MIKKISLHVIFCELCPKERSIYIQLLVFGSHWQSEGSRILMSATEFSSNKIDTLTNNS